jgi:hemolysin activation/secretion protein
MDPSIISALAALGGATIGGLTSVIGAWWAQQKQVTAQEFAQDKTRRQELYREFIQDASKTYAHALQNDKPDVSALVEIYTKISRMRILSSPKVVESADQVARAIVDAYLAPNVTVSELRDLMDKGRLDPLRVFSEACRAEFVGRFVAIETASGRDMETLLKLPQRLRSEISHQQS